MARIEWYAETNRKLNSSLTPNNRCTDKTTAINNYADPAPLANFEYNRLVPTSAGYVKLIEYIIRFLNWDGSVLLQVSVPRGTTPTYSGSTPSRTGYTWTGHWSPTDPVGATSATDYTATFEINTYTIRFLNYDGTVLLTRSINYGTVPTYTGSTPTRTGYTWTGNWTPTIVAAAADADYTATYTINTYSIRFLNYDGTVLQTKSVTYGTTPTYTGSTPTRTGYTWTGWSPTIASASANADYTATFNINTYTISYSTDVNGWTDTRSVTHGSQEPDIHPTISGYTFQYWTPALGTATGDASHVAHYTLNTVYYTITFEDYDGTPLWSGQVEAGTTPTYPYSNPTRSGWTFSGWSPSIGAATQDQTYTATYTEDVPRVVMLASVDWRVAVDADGTPYNDPSNMYMTDSRYLPSGVIAKNVWFEPWYKDVNTGVELTNHWTDPIATVDGVSVCHEDLTWTVTQPAVSDNGYWWWHKLGGGYNQYDSTVILRPYDLPTSDPKDNKPGRNWRMSVQSESNKQGDIMYRNLWEDKIPLRFVGTYNGQVVVDKQIKVWIH